MENKVKVWIARDKDRELFVYSDIPIRCKNHWGYPTCFYIDKSMFPSIKWEDDEPTEAYITLDEPQEQPTPKQEIDWEKRRYEIAKDILSTMFCHPKTAINRQEYINFAVKAADMLIKKLKEKSE